MATPNIITINELIKMFSDFSDSHLQLNDFGYGPTSEIGTSRQMEFPYLWVTHRTPSIINVTNKTQIPKLTLTFIVVDQINIQQNIMEVNGLNSDNQQEIVSDTFQIVQDLVTYISVSLGKYGVQLTEDSISVEPLFDQTPDKVTGWVLDINIQLKHSNCAYPTDGVAPIVPDVCPSSVIKNSDGSYSITLASGDNLILSDITITTGSGNLTYPSAIDINLSGFTSGSTQPINTANLIKTGANISYRTNDDATKLFGRDVDFFTLDHNNGFGNTDRFTDDLGTQVYATDVVIDWSTWNQLTDKVLGYYRVPLPNSNAYTTMLQQPFTRNGIADWWVTNIKQLQNLMYYGTTGNGDRFLYQPFNFQQDSTNRLHTSTYVRPGIVMVAYETNDGAIANHTTNSKAFLCREYTLTELGL